MECEANAASSVQSLCFTYLQAGPTGMIADLLIAQFFISKGQIGFHTCLSIPTTHFHNHVEYVESVRSLSHRRVWQDRFGIERSNPIRTRKIWVDYKNWAPNRSLGIPQRALWTMEATTGPWTLPQACISDNMQKFIRKRWLNTNNV